jgi:hypothetical protein
MSVLVVGKGGLKIFRNACIVGWCAVRARGRCRNCAKGHGRAGAVNGGSDEQGRARTGICLYRPTSGRAYVW